MKALLILCLIFFSSTCSAQLVNIESRRMQTDSVRLAGTIGLSFAYQETNNVALSSFHQTLAAQGKTKNLKNVLLLLTNYDVTRSKNLTLNNTAFAHLRYNYKFNSFLRLEVYNQIQFNQLLSLKYRYLVGAGPRFKITKGETFKSYLGTSAFFEHEQLQDSLQTINQGVRWSNYLVLSWKFPKDLGEFTSTTYFQPLFSRLEDYRLSTQNMISFNISKHLSFTTSFNYLFDAFPPEGVQREVISVMNGLKWTL